MVNRTAHIFFSMLDSGLSGLYHVFSGDCTDKYDFGVRIAEQFGLDAGLIAPVSVTRGGLTAARSPNLTMDTSRLSRALGQPLPRLTPMIEQFYTLYQQGYPQEVQGLLKTDPAK